jgi:hypothetical protein
MTDYIGLIQGRRATTDARLGQVLSWLRDVRPGTPDLAGSGNYVDAWRHGGTAALLAYHHGYDNVKRWGDALEDYRPDNEQEFRQDSTNNEVGAKIGALARITGMTIPELGDAVKAAFKAGAFQTDAYAPFSGSPTFRVGDMTLSVGSGVVTLPDGSRFDLTKSGIISDGGLEYPLLHVIRKDGSVQNNWTNMEDSRTLFQSGVGKWELPQSGDAPAASFSDRFAAMIPRASAAAGSLGGSATTPSTANGVLPGNALNGSIGTGNITPLNQTASMPWYSSPAVTGNYNPTDNFSWNNVPTGIFGSGNRGPSPAGGPGGAPSPTMRAPQKDRRSAAPDGTAWASAQGATSTTPAFQQDAAYSPTGDFYGNFPRMSAVAATPSPTASNGSGSGSGPRITDALNAAGKRAVPVLTRVGKFVGDSLITPAEGASPSGPLLRDPTAPNLPGDQTQGIDSDKPERRLSRRVVNPSAGVPGDARSSPAPQLQESQRPLSLMEAYLEYVARLNGNKPQAFMFDQAAPFDASDPNPFSGGLPGRLAAIAGIDPQNPTQFASSPQTRGLAGSFYGGNPLQPRTGAPVRDAPDNSAASGNANRNWYPPLGALLRDGDRSRAPVTDAGVPASPIVSSDSANYSGGLLGKFAALAGIDQQDPNQPAPLDDEQEQADLQALEAKVSSSGNIRDAVALYNARRANRRLMGVDLG